VSCVVVSCLLVGSESVSTMSSSNLDVSVSSKQIDRIQHKKRFHT
jgi:hypothetical protein